jgi:hypothetical protein
MSEILNMKFGCAPDTWTVIDRSWRTIMAPIFANFSGSVAIDHYATSADNAKVRRKLAT